MTPPRPTIRATCPYCGDVDLPPAAVTLHALDQTITYICPRCHRQIDVPACAAPIEERLLDAGVQVTVS